MTTYRARITGATVFGVAGCVLITACSSQAPHARRSVNSPQEKPATSPVVGQLASSAPKTSRETSSAAITGSSCRLVTGSEVGEATGKSMGKGADAGSICSYSATGDPSTVVYVQLYTDTQHMGAAKATEPGSEHLPGLGDDAFWTAAGTLFVQKGSRGFTISTPSLALASPRAPKSMITLAATALARL